MHKHHCKFLSGKKIAVGAEHDPANCTFCQEDLGQAGKPDNASFGCHFNFFSGMAEDKVLVRIQMKTQEGDLTRVPIPFSWYTLCFNLVK